MPRPLLFGNGRLLVQCDHRGNIRDFSWPVGIWNHLSGRAVRIGIWAEGGFSWLDAAGWERSHRYASAEPLVGVETHDSAELGVRLEITSWLFSPPPNPLPSKTMPFEERGSRNYSAQPGRYVGRISESYSLLPPFTCMRLASHSRRGPSAHTAKFPSNTVSVKGPE